MRSFVALIIGLALGAAGAGGYMYTQLQAALQVQTLAVTALQGAQKKSNDLEAKVQAADAAKGAADKSLAELKAQLGRLSDEKAAVEATLRTAETARKSADTDITQLKTQIGTLETRLIAAEGASRTAERQLSDLRTQLAQAIRAREDAEKALAEARKQ